MESPTASTCVESILHAIDAPDTLVDFLTGEHSSFLELDAFVRALCPREVVPTVNASTRDRRDKLRDLFSPGTDLKRDKGRMDAYLKGGALEAVDVQRQKRLLASFSKASEVEVDPALIEQLRGIIGEAPHDYCARLLRDASNATKQEGPREDDDRDLLVGAVFAVRGRDEDFKLFKGSSREPPPKRARGMPRPKAQQPGGAADRVRARLKQLGACVVERDAKGAKKLAPTHVIVPEGTEKGQLIGLDVLVRVRTESWPVWKSTSASEVISRRRRGRAGSVER